MEKYSTAKQETDDNRPTIWRMRIACRISKATDIISKYVIRISFFTENVDGRTRLIIILRLHFLSFYVFATDPSTSWRCAATH